jgi:hypothetical protein
MSRLARVYCRPCHAFYDSHFCVRTSHERAQTDRRHRSRVRLGKKWKSLVSHLLIFHLLHLLIKIHPKTTHVLLKYQTCTTHVHSQPMVWYWCWVAQTKFKLVGRKVVLSQRYLQYHYRQLYHVLMPAPVAPHPHHLVRSYRYHRWLFLQDLIRSLSCYFFP